MFLFMLNKQQFQLKSWHIHSDIRCVIGSVFPHVLWRILLRSVSDSSWMHERTMTFRNPGLPIVRLAARRSMYHCQRIPYYKKKKPILKHHTPIEHNVTQSGMHLPVFWVTCYLPVQNRRGPGLCICLSPSHMVCLLFYLENSHCQATWHNRQQEHNSPKQVADFSWFLH